MIVVKLAELVAATAAVRTLVAAIAAATALTANNAAVSKLLASAVPTARARVRAQWPRRTRAGPAGLRIVTRLSPGCRSRRGCEVRRPAAEGHGFPAAGVTYEATAGTAAANRGSTPNFRGGPSQVARGDPRWGRPQVLAHVVGNGGARSRTPGSLG